MPDESKRRITAEDLYRFQLVSDPQMSPDGEHVIFCVQRVDEKTEQKYTNLWLVSPAGGEARPFTHGDHKDTHPRWSPDGSQIAFLSNRDDEKQPQIYTIPFRGGEARPVTDLKGTFATFAWSPDGTQLACQFRKKDEEAIAREKDEQKKKLGVVSRHITRVFYKLDGSGYLPDERWHIWTVGVADGNATQLTDGDVYDETNPRWAPDGSKILFVSNRSDDPDFNPDETELYTVPAGGGAIQHIPAHDGRKSNPRYSPDGKWIAYRGRRLKGNMWQNACLYLVPAGGGEAHNLTVNHDLHVDNMTGSDVDIGFTPPTWAPDSQTIYIQVTRHGHQPLMAVSLADETVELRTIVDDPGTVGEFSLDASGETLAYFHTHFGDPGQIWVRDLAAGHSRRLTRFNHDWLDDVELGEVEEVHFEAKDGTPLHGWILKPPGFDADQTYPSILEIHGGPQTQYGNAFMHEFYFLAAPGYVVYFSNPRGSQGYGDAWAGAIYNNWGTVDFDDVMAWADYLEQLPYIDPERMGVTGGSYGGYMTGMIIGRSHRFRAAVSQRMVSNFISMWGSSDFNWWWSEYFTGRAPWEDLENYWRQSPMKYIGGAQTPTLIIHSEKDYRCNLEQAEQVYVALKMQGVDTEMVLFPEEPHGLSRTGRTDRRIVRLNHILRWFDKYLDGGG